MITKNLLQQVETTLQESGRHLYLKLTTFGSKLYSHSNGALVQDELLIIA